MKKATLAGGALVVATCVGFGAAPVPAGTKADTCPALRENNGEPVEVTFWFQPTDRQEVNFALAEEFNTSQTAVRINAVRLDKWVPHELGKTPRSEWPALVELPDHTLIDLVHSGAGQPIEHCLPPLGIELSDLDLTDFTFQDHAYAVPRHTWTPVMLYNRSTFSAAGLNPDDPPANLEELSAALAAIVESGAAKHGLVIPVGPDDFGLPILQACMSQADDGLADAENGRASLATQGRLTDASDFLRALRRFVQEGHAQPIDGLDTVVTAATLGVPREGAAITLMSSRYVPDVRRFVAAGTFADYGLDDIGVAALPCGDVAPVVLDSRGIYPLNNPDPNVRAAAMTFLAWLAQPDQQLRLSAPIGSIPASRIARLTLAATAPDAVGDPAEQYVRSLSGLEDRFEPGAALGDGDFLAIQTRATLGRIVHGEAETDVALEQLESFFQDALAATRALHEP